MPRKDRGLDATIDRNSYWAPKIAPVKNPAERCVAALRDKAYAEDIAFYLHRTQIFLEDSELISLMRWPGREIEGPSHLLLGIAEGGRNPRTSLHRNKPQLAKNQNIINIDKYIFIVKRLIIIDKGLKGPTYK